MAEQARVAALCLMLALGGCGGSDPFMTLGHAFGPASEGREPPPGLAEGTPYPALGTVPPRPVRPDPAARAALSEQLARERAVSAIPVPAAAQRGSRAGAGDGMAGPPAPPRLGPTLAIPASRAPGGPGTTAMPSTAPAGVQATAPDAAAAAPPAPSVPATIAAPPPPSADLLAPPRRE